MARSALYYMRGYMLGLSVLAVTACQPQNADVLLTTNQIEIRTTDLPLSTQIQLYESAMTQFQQTKLAIQHSVATNQQVVHTITDFVLPPSAPKTKIQGEPLWRERKGNGRHQIDWLCSYQSANCARLSAALQQFLPYLNGGYELNYYHAPQRFHKFANQAALGELCLNDASQRSQYRDYLWQQTGNLTPDIIRTGLLQRGLTHETINQCLSDKQNQLQLSAQAKALAAFDLHQQTSLWFNRIYVSQHHWQTELLGLLKPHLNVEAANAAPQDSGLTLKQLWQDPQAHITWAQYADPSARTTRLELYQPWPLTTAQIQKGTAWVYELNSAHIVLLQHGQLLTLSLQDATSISDPAKLTSHSSAPKPSAALTPAQQPASFTTERTERFDDSPAPVENNAEQTVENKTDEAGDGLATTAADESDIAAAERHRQRYEQAVAATPVQPISAQWLDQQLLRQTDLEQQLEPTPHEVEGHALLKLNGNEVDNFYQTLGIQPGDVIVRVNDQWVHQGNNPLWDLLQREERVTVSLIRKGMPVHLAFSKQ